MPSLANPVALTALLVAYILFLIAILRNSRRRRERPAEQGQRDRRSLAGIVLQSIGFALASFGQVRIADAPITGATAIAALPAALLAFGSLGLFLAASRAMGRNWAIVASTLTDHQLVTDGPFAWIRNPIYVAMLLMVLALALALGHPQTLIAAVPVFALGTWLRVTIEERLLANQFGVAYAAYAARVKRFVPGLF